MEQIVVSSHLPFFLCPTLQVCDLNLNENFISTLSASLSNAPRMKILRLQNNLLTLDAIPESLLSDSKVHDIS